MYSEGWHFIGWVAVWQLLDSVHQPYIHLFLMHMGNSRCIILIVLDKVRRQDNLEYIPHDNYIQEKKNPYPSSHLYVV